MGMILACVIAAQAPAQEYSFSVPKLQMFMTVQLDASLKIDYTIEFHNNPEAHLIDIIDIGTPHAGYRLGDIRAWIDDQPLQDIRPSTVVHPGFEVHLDNGAIMPGRTGTLRVVFTMPKMVYQDTTRKDYASLRITPTWFGEQYVTGNTYIQVAIQLPKNVKPDEVLYQNVPFKQRALIKEGVVVYWDFATERLTKEHMVGVSFPKGDIPVIKQNAIDLLLKWFSESPQARMMCGAIFLRCLPYFFSVLAAAPVLRCSSFFPGWRASAFISVRAGT